MIQSDALGPLPAAEVYRSNLRQLQEEALDWLYLGTSVVGVAWVAYCGPDLWRQGPLGIALILPPPLLRLLLSRHYLARAWTLIALWLGVIVLSVVTLSPSAALPLAALPVGLAVLFVSIPAGLGVAVGAGLAGAACRAAGLATLPAATWMGAAANIVGVWGLTALALRPLHEAVRWSWDHYDQARRQADQARNAQADLKQAVKDLADASTQMASLNQLLGAARRVAEEAERAKAQFVANVSHELRTPLNMIIGFAEMMLSAPKGYGRIPAALRADLAVILRNSQHLAELIDDVLDLSQIEAGQMALTREMCSLKEIVDAATEALRPLFQSKGLYLTTDVPPDLTLYCDRTRIREVMLNLLSNGGRFAEQGGVHVRAWKEGAHAVVSIADTGPGIAPQDQEKLFQPFQQVDGSIRRRYGGSGLGLAISRHFVELHGGAMRLESALGVGTTITFRLPVEEPLPGDRLASRWLSSEWEYRERVRHVAVPAPALRERLVVCERRAILQRLLGRYMADVEIVPVRTLEEAAQELARAPAQALLINDLAVAETLERVRQSSILPDGTPALVCSLPGEEEAALALGVAGYLVKPVSREGLLAELDRLQLRSGTVLIVDDEIEAIRLFWRMLTATGRSYRVLTATSAEAALNILRRERPDVILMDLVMPGTDGFQLLARRNEEEAWRDVPVIVLSARDPAGHPIMASALGLTCAGGLAVPRLLAYIQLACRGLGRGGN